MPYAAVHLEMLVINSQLAEIFAAIRALIWPVPRVDIQVVLVNCSIVEPTSTSLADKFELSVSRFAVTFVMNL